MLIRRYSVSCHLTHKSMYAVVCVCVCVLSPAFTICSIFRVSVVRIWIAIRGIVLATLYFYIESNVFSQNLDC